MPHKADSSFFDSKREWSKKKDAILGYYLTPYLAKVNKLGRPILLVDGFAGKGRFDDGEKGSPLILCDAMLAAGKHANSDSKVVCIEKHPGLHQQLQHNLASFEFAHAWLGSCSSRLLEIRNMAQTHSTFIYLDPYTYRGLDWSELAQVFELLRFHNSVEILMNFNATSFVRAGLATLKRLLSVEIPDRDEFDQEDTEFETKSTAPDLARVVGGDWWETVLRTQSEFSVMVDLIAQGVADRLKKYFAEVCYVNVKQKREHRVPKYFMIFASRHPDALLLMNDAMVKACCDYPAAEDLVLSHEISTVPTFEIGRLGMA